MGDLATKDFKLPAKEELQPIIEIFKTMSDPTRMKIILTVAQGPITVSDIAQTLALSASNVSHQLRLLKQERLVTGKRVDKQVFYSLIDDHVLQIYQLTKVHIEEKNEEENKHFKSSAL